MHDAAAIVRTKNSADTLAECIGSIRSQTVPVSVIVVDSGSTDETVALAGRLADHVTCIPTSDFTFGRALNVGARVARAAEVHIALSSHCAFPRPDWVATACANLARKDVVATGGDGRDVDRLPLRSQIVANHEVLVAHPWWGLSNHAAAWRSSAWTQEHFDEHLVACEDKEWSHRATRGGGVVVIDPRLRVAIDHRRSHGYRAYVRRVRREVVGLAAFADVPRFSLWGAVQEIVRRVPQDDFITHGRRLGRTRLLDCIARHMADREIHGASPSAS